MPPGSPRCAQATPPARLRRLSKRPAPIRWRGRCGAIWRTRCAWPMIRPASAPRLAAHWRLTRPIWPRTCGWRNCTSAAAMRRARCWPGAGPSSWRRKPSSWPPALRMSSRQGRPIAPDCAPNCTPRPKPSLRPAMGIIPPKRGASAHLSVLRKAGGRSTRITAPARCIRSCRPMNFSTANGSIGWPSLRRKPRRSSANWLRCWPIPARRCALM